MGNFSVPPWRKAKREASELLILINADLDSFQA